MPQGCTRQKAEQHPPLIGVRKRPIQITKLPTLSDKSSHVIHYFRVCSTFARRQQSIIVGLYSPPYDSRQDL